MQQCRCARGAPAVTNLHRNRAQRCVFALERVATRAFFIFPRAFDVSRVRGRDFRLDSSTLARARAASRQPRRRFGRLSHGVTRRADGVERRARDDRGGCIFIHRLHRARAASGGGCWRGARMCGARGDAPERVRARRVRLIVIRRVNRDATCAWREKSRAVIT